MFEDCGLLLTDGCLCRSEEDFKDALLCDPQPEEDSPPVPSAAFATTMITGSPKEHA